MSATQSSTLPPEVLHHNEGPSLVIVSAVSIPFALAVVATRVWARHRKHMALEIDDWFILASLVCLTLISRTPRSIVNCVASPYYGPTLLSRSQVSPRLRLRIEDMNNNTRTSRLLWWSWKASGS